MKHKNWMEAMSKEFQELMKNRTWELVPFLNHGKIISNRQGFAMKLKPI